METLHFQVDIQADVAKVYRIMLDQETYKQWTAVFNPTSSYEGTWEKGSKIRFVGINDEGKKEGLVGKIRENIPNRLVSIEYLGLLNGEEEIMEGPEIEEWIGITENYSFDGDDKHTLLSVDIDVTEAFKTYFLDTWPKALTELKTICEA